MPRRKYSDMPLPEIMRRLKESTLEGNGRIEKGRVESYSDGEILEPLEERVKRLMNIVNRKDRRADSMLFFVMYDIESNKVRYQIAKYLIREGCTRIQKSIFLADLPHEKVDRIREDLIEVQACYDNHDSILVVPVSTDCIQAMKIIGKSIDVDIITKSKNTLFF